MKPATPRLASADWATPNPPPSALIVRARAAPRHVDAAILHLAIAAALLLVSILVISACARAPTLSADDEGIDAVEAVAARPAPVRDYALAGEVTSPTGDVVHFTVDMKQPRSMKAVLVEQQKTVVFDGKTLTLIDDRAKTVVAQDLAALPETGQLALLHAIFSPFLCEGWRAPLLRAGKQQVARGVFAGEPRWTFDIPIDDDTLSKDRLTLRAPKADFVSRETLDKAGTVVAATRVTEEHTDAATGLSFPKRWERTDATGTTRYALTRIAINQGIEVARFDARAPAGSSLVNQRTAL